MKKSLLLTLAASAMLCASVFTGCSDLPEEYYPTAEQKAAAEAAAKKDKAVEVDLSKATLPWGGSISTANDVLEVDLTSEWAAVEIPLDTVDLTGKSITFEVQGICDGWKLALGSDETHRSCVEPNFDDDSKFKSYTFENSKFEPKWFTSATEHHEAVDFTKVKTIYVWANGKKGSCKISKISYK